MRKSAMYMKMKKKRLAETLYNANDTLEAISAIKPTHLNTWSGGLKPSGVDEHIIATDGMGTRIA